jgi:hypothetical protein
MEARGNPNSFLCLALTSEAISGDNTEISSLSAPIASMEVGFAGNKPREQPASHITEEAEYQTMDTFAGIMAMSCERSHDNCEVSLLQSR